MSEKDIIANKLREAVLCKEWQQKARDTEQLIEPKEIDGFSSYRQQSTCGCVLLSWVCELRRCKEEWKTMTIKTTMNTSQDVNTLNYTI